MKSTKSLHLSSSKRSVTSSIKSSPSKLNRTESLVKSIQKANKNDNSQILKNASSKLVFTPSHSKAELKENTPQIKFFEPKEFSIEDFMKQNTDENIKCMICNYILRDPISCNKCLKLFCNDCIKPILEKSVKCPNCFDISFINYMKKFNLAKLEKYTSKEAKCPYYGCMESRKIIDMRAHLENCIFGEHLYKKLLINKVIHNNSESDPCMKTHLLHYLKNVNKSLAELKNYKKSNQKSSVDLNKSSNKDKPTVTTPTVIKIDDLVFTPKLEDLKDQMNNLNDFISKSIVDLAKTTKQTNENLKNMINC